MPCALHDKSGALRGGRTRRGRLGPPIVRQKENPMTNEELIQKAQSVVKPRRISHDYGVGDVGCASLSGSGKV